MADECRDLVVVMVRLCGDAVEGMGCMKWWSGEAFGDVGCGGTV